MKLLKTLTCLALAAFAGAAMAAVDLTGSEAPDFALKSASGENLRLSEFRGDVVMLNFWATWCGPCRQEMPLLDEMYQRYRKVGFELLGVNIDEDTQRAEEMAATLDITFPLLFDLDKTVSKRYRIQAMPVSVLIDRRGVVRHVHYGYQPGDEQGYLDEIRKLLGE
ncbi:TlpA disulfide reductase family protein [soil metagenome]